MPRARFPASGSRPAGPCSGAGHGPGTVELKAYPAISAGKNAVPAGHPRRRFPLVRKAVEDTWLVVRVDNQTTREVPPPSAGSRSAGTRGQVLLSPGTRCSCDVQGPANRAAGPARRGEAILFTREIDWPQIVPEEGGGRRIGSTPAGELIGSPASLQRAQFFLKSGRLSGIR